MPFVSLDVNTPAVISSTLADPVTGGNGRTLQTFRQQLRAEIGNRTDVGDPELNGWINDAYVRIAAEHELSEFIASVPFTTVADQPFYQFPEWVWNIVFVSRINADDVEDGSQISKSSVEEYRQLPFMKGRPTKAFRYKRLLVLWPTPDTPEDLVADCRILPIKMTNDAHQTLLGVAWDEALQRKAAEITHVALKESKLAAQARNDHLAVVRQQLDRDSQETSNDIARVFVARSARDLIISPRISGV